MTTRRGFLGAILAAGVAPAFVGSGVLMPVRQTVTEVAEELMAARSIYAPGSGLRLGDIITIAGVEAADGTRRMFVVTEATSAGVLTLDVPAILPEPKRVQRVGDWTTRRAA